MIDSAAREAVDDTVFLRIGLLRAPQPKKVFGRLLESTECVSIYGEKNIKQFFLSFLNDF